MRNLIYLASYGTMDARLNPELSCILVDNFTMVGKVKWKIEPSTNYNLSSCGTTSLGSELIENTRSLVNLTENSFLLNVFFKEQGLVTLSKINGDIVFKNTFPAGDHTFKIQMLSWCIYLVKIESENKTLTYKFGI